MAKSVSVERRRSGHLWLGFGWHIALWLVAAMAAATASGTILWWALGHPNLDGPLDPKDRLELVKVALAVAAGIGGVVALVVAYRKQRLAETAEHRAEAAERREDTKLFNERFGKASEQLGSDKAAIRLAGAYAMAGLADDWEEGRQTCIDVLCSLIRMPWPPTDPETPPAEKREKDAIETPRTASNQIDQQEERQVRNTILRVVADHLRVGAPVTWQGRDLDFTGAILAGADFSNAQFPGGTVSFAGALFIGGRADFSEAEFSGGTVSFLGAEFMAGTADFADATFSSGVVAFDRARFSGGRVSFDRAAFTGGTADFNRAEFSDGEVTFPLAQFSDGKVSFVHATFTGGRVDLRSPHTYDTPPVFDDWADDPPEGLLLPGGDISRSPGTGPAETAD